MRIPKPKPQDTKERCKICNAILKDFALVLGNGNCTTCEREIKIVDSKKKHNEI